MSRTSDQPVIEATKIAGDLRIVLEQAKHSSWFQEHDVHRQAVLTRYRPLFHGMGLESLSAEDFYSFLLFENNRHWTGLNRPGKAITAEMPAVRNAIAVLGDSGLPLAERLDTALGLVKGMGKGIATAILIVLFPDECSVWNGTVEAALEKLEAWPDFERGTTTGQKYTRLNSIMLEVASLLEVDLWLLDALWWHLLKGEGPKPPQPGTPPPTETVPLEPQSFGLERHLHDFMRDNWKQLPLSKEWELYGNPGDEDPGYEFPTSIGRIDLLAKHKSRPAWLVIELKRNQTEDDTVGQVMRYMGWVSNNLARPEDEVNGLIIVRALTEKLKYATLPLADRLKLQAYEVQFMLKDLM